MGRPGVWIAILLLTISGWTTVAAALKGLHPGDTLADVTVVTAEEEPVRLSQLLSERGAVLVFWATWNPRSREILEFLRQAQGRYAAHALTVLPVNAEGEGVTPEQLRSHLQTYAAWQLPWPSYFDPELDAYAVAGVMTLPTLLYLNGELELVASYAGFPSEARDALPRLIEKGLGIPEPAPEVRRAVEVRYAPANGAGAVFHMGRLLYRKRQGKKASAYFRRAAKLDPDYPEPVTALSYLAHLAEDSSGEAAAVAQLRQRGRDSTRFQEAYGLSLLATGKGDAAKTVLGGVVTLETPHPKGVVALALLRALDGEVAAAEQLLDRLKSWPLGGVAMEIDVSSYIDPEAEPQRRWQDPDAVLRRLLELH